MKITNKFIIYCVKTGGDSSAAKCLATSESATADLKGVLMVAPPSTPICVEKIGKGEMKQSYKRFRTLMFRIVQMYLKKE